MRLFIMLLILIGSNINMGQQSRVKLIQSQIVNHEVKELQLTKQNLKNYIKSSMLKGKNIIYRKILLETGHLTSKNAIQYYNITGMKYVKSRKTTQIGCTPNGYGIYASWEDCLIDYYYWQQCKKNINRKKDYTDNEYLIMLKKWNYCPDKEYITTLKKMRNYNIYDPA